MKVINSTLAAIGLAAFVFASCSDSSSDPTDGTNPKVDVAETITANLTSSSAAELAARVSNYKNTTANARKFFFSRATQTRAFASADKVVIPAVPDNARQWSAPEDMKAGKTYLVTSKKTLDMSGYNVAGATIFVKGNSKLIFNSSIAGCKIYVDGGATLEYKGTGALEIPADATIINDGGSIIAENDINVAGKRVLVRCDFNVQMMVAVSVLSTLMTRTTRRPSSLLSTTSHSSRVLMPSSAVLSTL